jgi:hypothetical protein
MEEAEPEELEELEERAAALDKPGAAGGARRLWRRYLSLLALVGLLLVWGVKTSALPAAESAIPRVEEAAPAASDATTAAATAAAQTAQTAQAAQAPAPAAGSAPLPAGPGSAASAEPATAWAAAALVNAGLSTPPEPCLRELAAEVGRQLGGASHVPVYVGGVGDSGTRALVETLRAAVRMDFARMTSTHAGLDSLAFMARYPSCPSPGERPSVSAGELVNVLYNHMGLPLGFSREQAGERLWRRGVGFALEVLRAQTGALRHARARAHGLWGLKQPRLVALLPFFLALHGDELRYLHVVRDPRDSGSGGNGAPFEREMCSTLYRGEERRRVCGAIGTVAALEEFRAQWSLAVLDALQHVLRPHQYLVVRIEDLVAGDRAPYDRILRWLRALPPAQRPADADLVSEGALQAVVRQASDFRGSYFGSRFSTKDRASRNDAAQAVPAIRALFDRLGYRVPNGTASPAGWQPATLWLCDQPLC